MKKLAIVLGLIGFAVASEAFAAPVVFTDDFPGSGQTALGSAWTEYDGPTASEPENKNGWTIDGSSNLSLPTYYGDLNDKGDYPGHVGGYPDNDYVNLFMIDNIWGSDLRSVTMNVSDAQLSTPWEQIVIVVFENDGAGYDNYIKAGLHYLGDYSTVTKGLYWGAGKEVSQIWGLTEIASAADSAKDGHYVRVEKDANDSYSFAHSPDGTSWTSWGSSLTFGDGSPDKVGLIAIQGYPSTWGNDFDTTVDVDSFEVTAIPEPASLIVWCLLAGLGITGIWWRRRRKGA